MYTVKFDSKNFLIEFSTRYIFLKIENSCKNRINSTIQVTTSIIKIVATLLLKYKFC